MNKRAFAHDERSMQTAAPNGANSHILIVDDDEDIRESLRLILEDEGFTVGTAANGKVALDTINDHDHKPCLILLDLMMPEMDGLEFLERRQGDDQLRRIPVIVISAFPESHPKNIVTFLAKPINLPQLIALSHGHCAHAGAPH